MKVCVRNLLRPAHTLAFVFGLCPYRKFDERVYRRSILGTFLQLINVVSTISLQVYIAIFYLPKAVDARHECPSLTKCSCLIIQTSNMFLSLWLTIDRFVWASKTLHCLQLADELNKMIYRISSSKHQPFAFYMALVWTITFFLRLPVPANIEFMAMTLFVTTFVILYCETLVLEFVTMICISLDTINQTLQKWQISGNYDINHLMRLQSLYLKAAYLADAVNDTFGISWLASFSIRSIQIVLVPNWLLKVFETPIGSHDNEAPFRNNVKHAYVTFKLAVGVLRCFLIFYSLHQPSVKRFKMVGILRKMVTRSNDNEMSIKMNEFTLQIALRKMEFTAGGFFDMNLYHFGEIVGTWLTLLVILVQISG